ncbi:4Fe-4S binding protein [Fodinibius sediminis]|uniref:4Fe-4S dicluster domain-containing protein n=1 Tax=Fodinibius sediminis TaxID=1214077 RepID=A0A521CYY8_9BACT|nr:4Fe-4S dicluster domain-containing protein [Fodinibius sediminis]SMO64643.1 4Fe-4S dicluster domain-containing protein [Fodinibius sediminis]
MALLITDDCINCGYCLVECPNQAIYEPDMEWSLAEGTRLKGRVMVGEGREINAKKFHPPLSKQYHFIVPEKCSECKGAYDMPQCAEVCPNPESLRTGRHSEKIIGLLLKQFHMNPDVNE